MRQGHVYEPLLAQVPTHIPPRVPIPPYPTNVNPNSPYYVPCKCDYLNQIRYYNHRNNEFYYHTAAVDHNYSPHQAHPPPPPHPLHSPMAQGIGETEDIGNLTQAFPPHPVYYDPYGPYVPPVGHYPNAYYPPPGHPGYHNLEAGICELVLVILALLLWLYSFFRLYRVWQRTLNFSESSIQGPQGWDLLVNWIMERIRVKKLKVPGMNVRGRNKNMRRDAVCESITEVEPPPIGVPDIPKVALSRVATPDEAERGAVGVHSGSSPVVNHPSSVENLRAVTKTCYENELSRDEISTISSLKQEIELMTQARTPTQRVRLQASGKQRSLCETSSSSDRVHPYLDNDNQIIRSAQSSETLHDVHNRIE
ncbi:uncharacterized protein LOC131884172 [Tigriopus californicus]|uniref:uncharacterized protein LOC131884172 n=1 Tax=Tigriopus californicus TaxID=6832 RepID=UPI0027DA8ABD|nr:uncharacterized protein LOC131884172 [Tigriopus californicus]XP_059087842.1 uncharacterized protein LOC131884172 [Tigriopus californicus]XP_059087843.1 uncharacterized protein LOC131884172 [Tigriopus californicus]